MDNSKPIVRIKGYLDFVQTLYHQIENIDNN